MCVSESSEFHVMCILMTWNESYEFQAFVGVVSVICNVSCKSSSIERLYIGKVGELLGKV